MESGVLLFWLVLSGLSAVIARARGRRGWVWLLVSLLLSPLVALIGLALMPRMDGRAPGLAGDGDRVIYRGHVLRTSAGVVTVMGQEFASAGAAKAAVDRALGISPRES